MNILAAFNSLKEKLDGFMAKAESATTAAIAAFSAELIQLKAGALTELETANASVSDLTSKLSTATTDLSAATGSLTEIKTALTSAASALKLDLKADASPVETITALQGAVTTTLAKLNVPAGSIPAPKPSDTNKPAGGKTMTLKEFSALAPQQKMAFTKEVNLGAAKLVD